MLPQSLADNSGPPGDGAVMNSRLFSALSVAASSAGRGGRLAGNHGISGKVFAVPFGIGAGLAVIGNTPTAVINSNQATSFMIFARHFNGDTAYATDSDVHTHLFSVSNPLWPGQNGLQATIVDAAGNGPRTGINGFDLDNNPATQGDIMNGGGAPSVQWAPLSQ